MTSPELPSADYHRTPMTDRRPAPARSRARSRRRPLEPAHRRGAARRPAPLRRARRDPVRHRPEHPDRPTSPARARRHRPLDALPGAPDATRVRPHRRRPRPRLGPAPPRRLGHARPEPTPSRCATSRAAPRSRPAGSARPARRPSTPPKPRAIACSDRGEPGTKGPPSPVRISWRVAGRTGRRTRSGACPGRGRCRRHHRPCRPPIPPPPDRRPRLGPP